MLRGEIPDAFTISLANTLLFIGVSLEAIALLKLRGLFTKITQIFFVLLTVINIVGFQLIILLHNDENIRFGFASIATALLILIPAYRFIRSKHSSFLMRVIGYLYLLVILSLIGRGVTALLSSEIMGLFVPGIYQTISFVSIYLVMIVGNIGFVLLLKEDGDKELVRLASYDELTKTLNRRVFNLRGKKCLLECAEEKSPVSLLLMDIDFFKKINDQNGHSVGDQVIVDFSQRINRLLGLNDLFGRYGGDEFGILLPRMDSNSSTQFAEQIRVEIESAKISGVEWSYTLSLGVITVIPNEHTELDSLYATCDKALYMAKENGRNCVYRIKDGVSEPVI
ncbi:GGDEF domain-containing protein [Bacillaceae bacterium IKA-2]|nr:GGDEF domain-containing protein [Bacillaceae bacterium IKA-2]